MVARRGRIGRGTLDRRAADDRAPLVLTLTLSAIASAQTESVGILGGRAVALYAVAPVTLAALALSVTAALVSRHAVDPATVTAMNLGAHLSDAIRNAVTAAPQGS